MIGKLSFDKELEVMSKFNLDGNLWYLLRFLFIAKYEEDVEPLFTYLTKCTKSGAPREMLLELKTKKILKKSYQVPEIGQPLLVENIDFEESFLNKYFKTSLEAGQELFDTYPTFLKMDNGKLIPAKNIASRVVFNSLEAFFLTYAKSIRFSRELHEEIINSLVYAKENNIIQYGVVEYVISRKWEDHIKLMKDNNNGPLANRYDNTELV